ncbi:MAG: glycosyltransferase family 4 protein [Planctomycetota bacterium]
MRIGMDYRPAMGPTTGIGRYVRHLAGALAPQSDLSLYGCFRRGNRPDRRKAPAGAALVAWPVPSRVMGGLARAGILPTERLLLGCDVFHHTNYLLVALRADTPQVFTLHDLAFLKGDYHPPPATEALKRVVERAAERCTVFCVPSEATADDCVALLGLDRERLFVTPLGVDARFSGLAAVPPAGRPYVLSVGTLEPRKNQMRLVQAMGGIDADLVIAGARGWMCDALLEAIARFPNVAWEGGVSEERLLELYAGASAVAYPSLCEGFGLPVLEALAAGKPVLTSDVAPLATDAALCVDPEDDDALAEGLRRVLFDDALRERLARAGPDYARAFTWEACAEATRRAYRAAVA